jgi:hypothetical protein
VSSDPETPGGGLPRRVRQANLTPKLRSGPHASSRDQDAEDDPAARSPEQARATMAAYHNGWARGRSAPREWKAHGRSTDERGSA